jgi:UDP-2,3-diacylglucosamine hydrolase
MPEAIIFSDAHISDDNESGLARMEAFLAQVCPSARRLFILGDLFDFWFGPAQAGITPYSNVLEGILALARSGIQVTFYRGNRDCYITGAIAHQYGFRLVDDYSIENICGAKVLLCHGDKLCANDKNYHRASAIIRNPLVRFILTSMPISLARQLALFYRRWSVRAIASKSTHVLGIDDDAVRRLFALGADVIIAGHTHCSGRREVDTPDGKHLIYTIGDFGTDGSYLECGPDGIVARTLSDSLSAPAAGAH